MATSYAHDCSKAKAEVKKSDESTADAWAVECSEAQAKVDDSEGALASASAEESSKAKAEVKKSDGGQASANASRYSEAEAKVDNNAYNAFADAIARLFSKSVARARGEDTTATAESRWFSYARARADGDGTGSGATAIAFSDADALTTEYGTISLALAAYFSYASARDGVAAAFIFADAVTEGGLAVAIFGGEAYGGQGVSCAGIAFAVSDDGSETCLSKSPLLLIAKRILHAM